MVFLVAAACVAACVYFGIANYDAYCKRGELLEKTNALKDKAAKIKADNEFKKEYFERVATDEDFAARVVRETLGYVGENEIIFKFDSPAFSSKNGAGVVVEKKSGK